MSWLLLFTTLSTAQEPVAPPPQAEPATDAPAERDPSTSEDTLPPTNPLLEQTLDLLDLQRAEELQRIPGVARPWTPPEQEWRSQQLGPWPDGYTPTGERMVMLPTLDPITGRILDAGIPMEGEWQGPEVPPALPGMQSGEVADPSTSLAPEGVGGAKDLGESDAVDPAAPSDPDPAPTPVVQPPDIQVQAPGGAWPFTPVRGGQDFGDAFAWFMLSVFSVLVVRGIDKLKRKLTKRGLIPVSLRTIAIVLRLLALIGVLFGAAHLVPDEYGQYFPVVLVTSAAALGWSARDLLHDLFAGVLLVVENRVVTDMRVEADGRVGTVLSVGFRSVSMESDDGQIIRIPNRDFLSTDTRTDMDPYAPVEVVVEAPPGARRRLEEVVLASPLVAPGHAPEVFRDPEHPGRWVVRARLVHPRWTLAFRGSVLDRLDPRVCGDPEQA
ncbi:MAG: mechanosensitive ion channel domain-containing protein [Myxococcota bacterium]|nr:mechanosensitive ion channel domain-containing protein [Myxococcota bacterium]